MIMAEVTTKTTAGAVIAGALAIQVALSVFDDEPSEVAQKESLEVLLMLKLVREVADGPPTPVDALVSALAPHFSRGFPDDPVEDDMLLVMTVAMIALKDLTGLGSTEHADVEVLVDRPGWIPSLVARAAELMSEVRAARLH
jgi:hypothetical protein